MGKITYMTGVKFVRPEKSMIDITDIKDNRPTARQIWWRGYWTGYVIGAASCIVPLIIMAVLRHA